MITTNIPESNARKSAEDELVEFILSRLACEDKMRFSYFICGCAMGTWVGYVKPDHNDEHHASVSVIHTVLRAFRNKGYLVNDRPTSGNINNVEIRK